MERRASDELARAAKAKVQVAGAGEGALGDEFQRGRRSGPPKITPGLGCEQRQRRPGVRTSTGEAPDRRMCCAGGCCNVQPSAEDVALLNEQIFRVGLRLRRRCRWAWR